MLVRMRRAAQSWIAKFVAGVIIVVLVLFGFGAFNLFSVNEPIVASVDGVDITESRLANEIERAKQNFRDAYGEQVSDEQLDSWVDDEFALTRLIDTQLFTNATQDLALTLSDARFQQSIQSNPVFQTEGEFDEQSFRETLQRSGLTAQSLREIEEDADVRRQLLDLLETTSFATPEETKLLATFDQQTRDLSSLVFSIATFQENIEISEDEILEDYELNPDLYMTNGEFDFEYIQLDAQLFTPETEITEEEVQELYDNEVAAKDSNAQRRGSHILISIDSDRTKEQAFEEINQVAQRLNDGEDFAALATELSEDPGSAQTGGDLGMAQRSTFVKPFADMLWSLDLNAVSDPVETNFGYHIIKLLEIEEVVHESLEDRREVLIASRNQEIANERLEEEAANVDKLAFENADSLASIASEYGIEIQVIEDVDSFSTEGILSEGQVRGAFFDTDVVDNNFNSRVVNLRQESLVVGRLLNRTDPKLRPFDEVQEEIKNRLTQEASELARDEAFENTLASLKEDLNFDAAEEVSKSTWQVHEAQVRDDFTVDPAVLTVAFNTALPASGDRVITEATSEFTSDKFIVVVSRQSLANYSVLPSTTQEELTNRVSEEAKTQVLSSFVAGLRSEASIKTELISLE